MRRYWCKLVCTGLTAGTLFAIISAYFYEVHVGWEIWWEVPFILALGISVWLIDK